MQSAHLIEVASNYEAAANGRETEGGDRSNHRADTGSEGSADAESGVACESCSVDINGERTAGGICILQLSQ